MAREIGRGINGIVYYNPALKCEDDTQPEGEYISKLMSKKKAGAEYSQAELIRRAIPYAAIYPEYMCKSSVIEDDKDTLLFSKFGGEPFSIYFEYLDTYTKGTTPKFNNEDHNTILNALYILRDQIKDMNAKGLYHNDINVENILYNETTNTMYLIDFARADTKNREQKYVKRDLSDDITSINFILESTLNLGEKAQKTTNGGRRKTRRRRTKMR